MSPFSAASQAAFEDAIGEVVGLPGGGTSPRSSSSGIDIDTGVRAGAGVIGPARSSPDVELGFGIGILKSAEATVGSKVGDAVSLLSSSDGSRVVTSGGKVKGGDPSGATVGHAVSLLMNSDGSEVTTNGGKVKGDGEPSLDASSTGI